MWQMESNVRQGVILANPKTGEERSEVAQSCVRKLGIKMPALIDGLDNRVEQAYTGWPDRMYVVDRQGRIAFKSAAGPFGFDPKAMQAALERVL
jgi:hypothetical protein